MTHSWKFANFKTSDTRFNNIHIGIVGPLPPSKGWVYLLTCIHHFTRWLEVILIPDMTADTVAHTFISGWITRFGMPSSVTPDCGWQFESRLWYSLMELIGCSHIDTTSYHLMSNRPLSDFIVNFKYPSKLVTIQSLGQSHFNDPTECSHYYTFKANFPCTTAELVYVTTLRLPSNISFSNITLMQQ